MDTNKPRWAAIPQLPRAHYEIDVAWHAIERNLDWLATGAGINLDPDYQRSHVWTSDQQVAYVEYILMGGEVGRNITWNAVDWPDVSGPVELVDGKQRLEAVRRFIRGEMECFGMTYQAGELIRIHQGTFKFRICSLDRVEVLRLYLNINAGGTPHTADELARVRALLDAERSKP
jgi:hypothetical protein